MKSPQVGVLALQGAFREHMQAMEALDIAAREVRSLKDLDGVEALIIPGGESTTIGKLLVDLDMMPAVKDKVAAGMPVFGTCAGLILLCENIENSDQPRIGGLNATVRRNAFGRQVDSFEAELAIPALGSQPFPGVFIRAPIILATDPQVEILATVTQNGDTLPVAVSQGNILAASFHPELTRDLRFHKYFLEICGK